jgi:hypothetical protein
MVSTRIIVIHLQVKLKVSCDQKEELLRSRTSSKAAPCCRHNRKSPWYMLRKWWKHKVNDVSTMKLFPIHAV